MTLITGQVSDVGMNNASGVFYARATEFRGDGTTVVSPSPATFTITGGAVSAEVEPGPTIITLHVGPVRKDWFVNVPETDVGLGDLIATYMEYEPAVVSAAIKARDAAIEAESEAKQAAIDAEAKRVAAETAASLTGADRLHVDNVRALLDETYDQSQAGMALPPRLTETALNATYAPVGSGRDGVVSPLFVENFTFGLSYRTPSNARTGLPTTEMPGGGWTHELALPATGVKGSSTLTCTAPQADIDAIQTGTFYPMDVALNSADGAQDFLNVLVGKGSGTLTLGYPLAQNFSGTLTWKHDSPGGQHLTRGATRAYAQHAAEVVRDVTASRGRILDGSWGTRPASGYPVWTLNSALSAYGTPTINEITAGFIDRPAVRNLIRVDYPNTPTTLMAGPDVGVHEVGHGVECVLRPARRRSVLEFWTGGDIPGGDPVTDQADVQFGVTVTADGHTVYAQTHTKFARQVIVPLADVDEVTITVTATVAGPFVIYPGQVILREMGSDTSGPLTGKKIVTVGDSWFAWYDGEFAKALAAKTGAEVVNHSLGSQTSFWALAWFDQYVAAEKPDMAIFHFFTNDLNNNQNQTGSLLMPDGSQGSNWPAGLSQEDANALWRANMRLLIGQCQRLGIRPVVMLPTMTGGQDQGQKFIDAAWTLDAPPLAEWVAQTGEDGDPTAYMNRVGKRAGTRATVSGMDVVAQGPAPSDQWINRAYETSLQVAIAGKTVGTYDKSTAQIGVDANGNGLSDGLTQLTNGSLSAGSTVASSIVDGAQHFDITYAPGDDGNFRWFYQGEVVEGREYLQMLVVSGLPANATADDTFTQLTAATTYVRPGPTANLTVGADGSGILYYRRESEVTGDRYLLFGWLHPQPATSITIHQARCVDLTQLFADVPALADVPTGRLAAVLAGMS